MKQKFYVYPWKVGSRSARALADALEGKVLKVEGSSYIPRQHKKVINWGSSSCPWEGLNKHYIDVVSNKLLFFSSIYDHENKPNLPEFTTSRQEASEWLYTERFKKVVCRTVLTGHSGQGIIIAETPEELVDAPLYVEYIPKDAEYRIHVFKNSQGQYEVLDVQRKVRDPDREPTDWRIRSHHNGFIFSRRDSNGVPYRDSLSVDHQQQAIRALEVSGLDFGGVDLIVNNHREKAYILEVNSAVGLEGETVNIYADAIRRRFDVV